MKHFASFFLSCQSILPVKRSLILLNAAFAIAILDLSSQVNLPLFVYMLPKYLEDSKFSSCFWCIITFTGNGCLEINTMRQRRYVHQCEVELWNYGIVELWNRGILELWNCGIVEFWNCGIVEL
jgi:hypothetical protein